jgi:hypothetical protein
MTTETRRLRIPYPSDGQDPYYPAFDAMVKAIDAMGFADVSDRNTLFYGGGTILWEVGAKLTFDEPINYVEPTYGQRQVMNPPANPIAIPAGHFLVTELSRGSTSSVDLEPIVVSGVTPSVFASVLAWHNPADGSLIWRSGARQLLGEAIGDVGNSGASDTADYVVVRRSAELPNSRVLSAGDGLIYTDEGPQGQVTFGLDGEIAPDIAGQEFTFASLTVDRYGRVTAASSGTPTAFFERHIEMTVAPDDANFVSVTGVGLKPFGEPVPTARFVLFTREDGERDPAMSRSWRSINVGANTPYHTKMHYPFTVPLDARRYGDDDVFMRLHLGGSGIDPNPELRLTLSLGGVLYAEVKVAYNEARQYIIKASDFNLDGVQALAGRRAVLTASYINYAGIGADYTVDFGPLDLVFLNTDPVAP